MTPQNQEEKIEIDFFKFSIPLGGKEQENKTKMKLINLLQTTIYILMTSLIITLTPIIYYCFLAKTFPNSTKIQYLCCILIISSIALLLSLAFIKRRLNIPCKEILKPKGKWITNNFLLNTLIILVLTSAYTYKELPLETAIQESKQQYITENIKEIKEKLKDNKNINTSEIINKLDELNSEIGNTTDNGNFITYLITCFMSAFLLYLPAAWFFAKKDIEEYLDKIDKNLVTTSENNNSLNSQN